MLIPALFTRMSTRPNSSIVALTIFATSPSSVTSVGTPMAITPRPRSSSRAESVFCWLRAATTMLAPAWASPLAIPRPMPPLPPVTIAALPDRSKLVLDIFESPYVGCSGC